MIATEKQEHAAALGREQVQLEIDAEIAHIRDHETNKIVTQLVENVSRVQEALKDLKNDVEEGECEKHRLVTMISDLARDLVVQECESVSLNLQKDRLLEEISKIQILHAEMLSAVQKQINDIHNLHDDKEREYRQLSVEMTDKEDELKYWTQKAAELNLQVTQKQCEIDYLDERLNETRYEEQLIAKVAEAERLVRMKTDLYINNQRNAIEQQARLKGFQIKADYLDGKFN